MASRQVGRHRSGKAIGAGKKWGPKRQRLLSRATVHRIDRALQKRERADGRRACREGADG